MELPHVFTGDPLDRADAQRRDPHWIEARLRDDASRFLPLHRLRIPVRPGDPPALAWQGRMSLAHMAETADPILLGVRDGAAHFAFAVREDATADAIIEDAAFEDPRGIAPHLDRADSGLLAHAKSLVDWHERHRFCARCGAGTRPTLGGKERICEACAAHHFPRTDPVVIMLVIDGDRCLLGRNRQRVNDLYSALAGFVDQGESIEEAVRREVMEEAGIRVGEVTYHSSQPWPFPSSLMIGCMAVAESTDVVIDEHELADVRWFGRDELARAMDDGERTGDGFRLPGTIAIAHFLVRSWLAGDHPASR